MSSSQNNFVAIVDLPEGEHQYKFYVDGQWTHDPTEVHKHPHDGKHGHNANSIRRLTLCFKSKCFWTRAVQTNSPLSVFNRGILNLHIHTTIVQEESWAMTIQRHVSTNIPSTLITFHS